MLALLVKSQRSPNMLSEAKVAMIADVYNMMHQQNMHWTEWTKRIAKDVSLLAYCIIHDVDMCISPKSKLYKMLKVNIHPESPIWKHIQNEAV